MLWSRRCRSAPRRRRRNNQALLVDNHLACVRINAVPESQWEFTHSIRMIRQSMGGRMYPLTLEGLDRAMRELVR